jgi:hypothetical protein
VAEDRPGSPLRVIAIIRGWSLEGLRAASNGIRWVDDFLIFDAVKDGRADAGVLCEPMLDHLINKRGLASDDITVVWRSQAAAAPPSSCSARWRRRSWAVAAGPTSCLARARVAGLAMSGMTPVKSRMHGVRAAGTLAWVGAGLVVQYVLPAPGL